jgi:RimJ/RimL family protein N-acetyltransferase
MFSPRFLPDSPPPSRRALSPPVRPQGIGLPGRPAARFAELMTRRFPDDVPVLSDGTVRLRPHRPQDIAAVVEQCADPDSVRFTTVPRPYGPHQAREFLELVCREWEESSPTSARSWAIDLGQDPDPVPFAGSIDYRPTGAGTAEVGYGLHPKARGRGLTVRALNLVLDYAFGRDGIEVMHWRAVVGNWASRKVAWRCGFRVEGTVRRFCALPGGAQDAWIGSLHRDDPRRPCEPWPAGDSRHGPGPAPVPETRGPFEPGPARG